MMDLPAYLPPRWLENMRLRRACLFHFRPERAVSTVEARSVALGLIAGNGEGAWHCGVVRLDAGGHDWEFRFKPQIGRSRPTRLPTRSC